MNKQEVVLNYIANELNQIDFMGGVQVQLITKPFDIDNKTKPVLSKKTTTMTITPTINFTQITLMLSEGLLY